MKITKPTLILNEDICKANIARMAKKAKDNGLDFQPHFKTHQSHKIGEWFKEVGVKAITVSSVGMAEYFAQNGWNDITIAIPCNLLQIEAVNALADKINLTLLVDNLDTVNLLSQKLSFPVSILIEINTGANRTGIQAESKEVIESVADQIHSSTNLNFKGLYSHAGHTYSAKGKVEVEQIAKSSLEKLIRLRDHLKSKYPTIIACFGDTPSCSVLEDIAQVDIISPGNFVFYDVMQSEIGSCTMENIAVAVACPVISKKEKEKQLVIYGGAIHFSKDFSQTYKFGQVVKFKNNSWEIVPNAYLERVSQEHGIISIDNLAISEFDIGDVIGVLPIHSCLTAECLGYYQTFKGELIKHYSIKKHA